MKKKNLLLYGLMATMGLSLSSCGDGFLSVEPSSSLPIDGYYNTQAHIDEALTAAYDPLHWYDYYNGYAPLFLVTDIQGDDLYVGGNSTSDQVEMHLASQYKATSLMTFGCAWNTSYNGINRSNLVISDAEASDNITDAQKKVYIDEAKTTRAFYYLVLWKFWGNVPYYDKNLEAPYLAEQLPASEVYAKVIADLEDVINDNVLPMKETVSHDGHATKAFAEMLYADYVMYQKDESRYGTALKYMQEIINSGDYALMDNYADIWTASGEWCKESIFEINYQSQGSKRNWGTPGGPGGSVVPALIGIYGLSYSVSDEHKAEGLNATADFNTGGWGFGNVSKEVYDLYEQNDQRRTGGLVYMPEYAEDYHKRTGDYVTYTGRYQNTGVFLRKYLGQPGGNAGFLGASALAWDNNYRVYRYSETLLNAAELLLRTNGDQALAQRYFDEVRNRANASHRTVSLDNILEERRLEFVGEGKRYYDLIRFGKAAEVLKPGGGKVLNRAKTEYNVQAIPERIQWTENKKYLPIPQNEIEAAKGTLKQNDY